MGKILVTGGAGYVGSHIVRALAERGINVEDLNTECAHAPMSGELLFKAAAQLRVPTGVRIEEVEQQRKQLEDKLTRDGAIMSDGEITRLERDIIARRRKLKNEQTAFRYGIVAAPRTRVLGSGLAPSKMACLWCGRIARPG